MALLMVCCCLIVEAAWCKRFSMGFVFSCLIRLWRNHSRSRTDAFQFSPFGLRDDEMHKKKGDDTERPVNYEGKCVAGGFNKREKCERHDEVGRSRSDGCSGYATAAQLQGEHLGYEDPCDWPHAECEAGDVDH